MFIIAKTFQGFEDVLKDEIKDLGGKNIQRLTRAVMYEGDKRLLYLSNLQLRTALKIIVPIQEFVATDEHKFYTAIRNMPWNRYLTTAKTFAVSATVNSRVFHHSKYIALKAKDAIVDEFRSRTGRRPSVSVTNPDVSINIHIRETTCTVSLDSSGESLHKRGYKYASGMAPVSEVLAAGLLMMTEFEKHEHFHDPMCGSGTFLSEAMMIHTHTPANFFRDEFAFMKWRDYDESLYEKLRQSLKKKITPPTIHFSGADTNRHVLTLARRNLENIPFGEKIELSKQNFFEPVECRPGLFMIMNPPYNVRLGLDNAIDFYKKIGDKLKQHCPQSTAWVLSGNLEALKFLGLKPSKKIRVMNGKLPAGLNKIVIF